MLTATSLLFCLAICHAQQATDNTTNSLQNENEYIAKVGNFSIECLYNTAKNLVPGQNMIMSPITIFTALAVMSEGSSGVTKNEINFSLRINSRSLTSTRQRLSEIHQWIWPKSSSLDVAKFNGIFVDKERLPLQDFIDMIKTYYATDMLSLNFKAPNTANLLNQVVSNFTNGKIPSIVDSDLFENSVMFLASAVSFKGKWAIPFNLTATSIKPFYDEKHFQTGEVTMMYNRASYPYTNIKNLQARVIELPYGNENRMAMLVMLPDPDVSLEDMMVNFKTVSLRTVFDLLRIAKDEYSDDEVDCFIPKFKIKSDLDLTYIIKRLGIYGMFEVTARLPYMARTVMHVSKLVHKAEVEVTEEGVSDPVPAVPMDEYDNRFGVARFEANRPFAFLIVEKITETIVFGGFYRQPSLFKP